ncbi:MAG: hypothetical protein EOO36_02885 [Cytophagaceae bacterium]|nr:MAG: hypothetical protein EOO36_02885 [Cytophagaceae bacterium]
MLTFTEDQAAALVLDAGTLKRGRELAGPAKWAGLGRTDTAAGGGAKPYLTGIDLSEPAFKCLCPSRVFPCKHRAGLLLLLAWQPALLLTGAPPAWLAEWLEKRQAKNAEQAKKASQAPTDAVLAGAPTASAAPSPAQLKREAQRHARMQLLNLGPPPTTDSLEVEWALIHTVDLLSAEDLQEAVLLAHDTEVKQTVEIRLANYFKKNP